MRNLTPSERAHWQHQHAWQRGIRDARHRYHTWGWADRIPGTISDYGRAYNRESRILNWRKNWIPTAIVLLIVMPFLLAIWPILLILAVILILWRR